MKKDFIYLDILDSMWHEYQKQNIKNTIELDYESLSVHPMWVKKDKRINFLNKQTEVDKHSPTEIEWEKIYKKHGEKRR